MFAPIGAAVLVILTAACAGENAGGPSAVAPTAGPEALFDTRAAQVAEAWRQAPGTDRWRTGFVPLQDLTVPVGDPGFTDETKHAFAAGWFRTSGRLAGGAAGRGTITFADGQRMDVPLLSVAGAYQEMDQGDPPPCQGPAEPDPTATGGADGVDSTTLPQACAALTVTAARLGTVPLLTSRGQATVPAYLFTVRGLKAPIARVAVDPSAITKSPVAEAPAAEQPPSWLRSAQGISRIDGTTLEYRLGLGACDVDVRPLFTEYDDVVVVGGTARTKGDVCTDQLVLKPVTVTLAEPLGQRVVIDAGTGQPQTLSATGG